MEAMLAPDGGTRIMQLGEASSDDLYVRNLHGKKLLKLVVKDEKSGPGVTPNAQIKLIPHGLRKVLIWEDAPTDPRTIRLSCAKKMELTYHGPGLAGQPPKIHLFDANGKGQLPKTPLLEFVLPLDYDLQQLVPLFSLCPGYAWNTPVLDVISKKAHDFRVSEPGAVQVDFYLSSANLDLEAAINSHYGLSLSFTFDYLSLKKRGMLSPANFLMPIMGFRMRRYALWARCLRSEYAGRPLLQFFRNESYYEKFTNRRTAWHAQDGQIVWSTIAEEAMTAARERLDNKDW